MPSELSVVRIAGWLVAAAFLGLVLFNAVFMVLSPEAWSHLRHCLALNGWVRYNPQLLRTRPWQIRFVGLVFTAAVCSFLFQVLGIVESRITRIPSWPMARGPLYTGWCLAPCLGGVVYGVWCLLQPQRWFDKYFRRPEFDIRPEGERVVLWAMRVMSFVLVLISAYFAWGCVRGCCLL